MLCTMPSPASSAHGTTGILGYGSLLDDLGEELAAQVVRRRDGFVTPFRVEFARSSRMRDGAPTLVPVSDAGASVAASVLVCDASVTPDRVRELLYRREAPTGKRRAADVRWIKTVELPGFGRCFYTALPSNIKPLSPQRLAELAIHSARAAAGGIRRDGISYLAAQRRRGLVTPLAEQYEAEVLARLGAADLDDAWRLARSS
jgi:hypothetical protein